MIPKVIHTFWLSNTKPADFLEKNIETWKSCNPDYEIKIHKLDEFKDLVNNIPYLKYTIDTEQWAYATDYLRSKVLYEEGGWYLDGDVICYKSFDEIINTINLDIYVSKEAYTNYIECAVIGVVKKHPIMLELCKYYEDWNYTRCIVMPLVLHSILIGSKLKIDNIFDAEVFSGILDKDTRLIHKTENSITIHKFTHTGYNFKLRNIKDDLQRRKLYS